MAEEWRQGNELKSIPLPPFLCQICPYFSAKKSTELPFRVTPASNPPSPLFFAKSDFGIS